MSDQDVIQRAVFEAFGAVKLDYRSPKRLDEAAGIVAEFVMAALARDRIENCKHQRANGSGSLGSDGSSKMSWRCQDCGKSWVQETPPHPQGPDRWLPMNGHSKGA